MLVELERVGKDFSGRALLREIHGHIKEGDRIGLIGRNGAGKTTLLNLILGTLEADEGRITRARGIEIVCVEQLAVFASDTSVFSFALHAFDSIRKMEDRLRRLEHEISSCREAIPAETAAEYSLLEHRLKLAGGYDYKNRTESVLMGLGFDRRDLTRPCPQLSGGEKRRLLLARALLDPGDLLLLDEPTNHLDLKGILWLRDFLKASGESLLVVSHDRQFLDDLTTGTWELEGTLLFTYPASYSRSRRLREERRLRLEKTVAQQQQWKLKTEEFIRRNMAGQKTRQAQSRLKQLEKTEWLEDPVEEDQTLLQLRISESRRGGSLTFSLEEGTIGFPGCPLLEAVNLRLLRGERVGIVGDNGSGKSTLLRTLAGEVKLMEGGLSWGAHIDPCYLPQEPRLGDLERTVVDFMRDFAPLWSDGRLRSLAAAFSFRQEDVFKKLAQLSGGERSRLALIQLFFVPSNFLLLDEPTNHLDVASCEALEAALEEFQGSLLVVSHDLYFLKRTVSRFLVLEGGGWHQVDDVEGLTLQTLRRLRAGENERHVPSEATSREKKKTRRATALSKNEIERRRRRLEQLEEGIEQLEVEKKSVLAALHDRQRDFVERNELAARHQDIDDRLQEMMEQWESVASEIAEARAD